MSKHRPCKGCKYYVFTVSPYYRAVVEGCNRQDWKGIKKNKLGDQMPTDCYVPAELEGEEE